MPIDPSVIDVEGMQQQLDTAKEYLKDYHQSNEAAEVKQQEEEQALAKSTAVKEDPRNADKWGMRAIAEEFKSIGAGGIQDTASSLMTFPERTIDAISGEMQRERKEKGFYRPEWDPLVDNENPIITKTWWGKLLRGTVHFGTMAAAIIPAAKVTAARMGIAGTGILANSLVRAAGVGAASDLISKESDADNALGMLRDRYGFMDTPISTRDTDHPIMMKFKNIVEGMGIGLVFDSAFMALGKGSAKAQQVIKDRAKSVEVQTIRKGMQELRKFEFQVRASKNKPIVGPHQGSHMSKDDPFVVWENQKRVRNTWDGQEGSPGNVTTPVQRERVAREGDVSEEVVESVLRDLYSNEKMRATLDYVGGSRRRLVEIFGDSIAMHQRITNGRNAADMDADEYIAELLESFDLYDAGTKDQIQTITSKNVVAADLVVGTLLHQLKNLGISGREIANWNKLGDIDGPADQILDTMLTLLTEVKRARIVKSQNFRELAAGKRRGYMNETLAADMSDARDSIMAILQIAKDEPDENMLNALFEAFSSMKTVNSVDDFEAWARKMIKGGDIEGKKQTGALIRELEGVMIHSILSGPKTPLRAIMGTSTATFLRPISLTLGAAVQLPFTGDTATLRVGLAQMNAMIEAIPESFELFKTKLNSYWAGDIATIKTRFNEYTRGNDNWELLRRFHESDSATDGDKFLFNMANMARELNNNRFLTYSTKLMAATDDAFGYILGRIKMRERALRTAMDAQAAGRLTAYPSITPELIRIYEDDFYRQIFDADGNIIDEATKFARKEVTLTQELEGFPAGLNQVFQAHPGLKPFFLFAKTGVNGLTLTAKHTPGFNFLVKEFNDIAFATAKQVEAGDLSKYGITNMTELANARALQTGRLAIGSALTMMAIQAYLRGDLTGNGPIDRQKRQVWLDNRYNQRSIRLAGVWVGHESIEPFSQIFTLIADIGDMSQLMGEEWTENQYQKVALLIAQGVASKSYLQGLQQFVDLVAGRPGQGNRILANIANNQIPMAGIRNELGKILNPHTKELGSGILQSWRNRNQFAEFLPGEDLPIKYDMLNGTPIKDWDPMTRLAQAILPIPLNLDETSRYDEVSGEWVMSGRGLLFASGYDTRLSVYSSPDGKLDLTDSPMVRSDFQRAIGLTKINGKNLEQALDALAVDPKVLASIELMNKDIRTNRADYEVDDYNHIAKIDNVMQKYRRKAWASIADDPEIVKLYEESREARIKKIKKYRETKELAPILELQPK